MEQYSVTGMSCAACSARVEKAVSAVDGVTSCSVSLLTNSMRVEGTADFGLVIKAVTEAGYGAALKTGIASNNKNTSDNNSNNTTAYVPDYENELKDTESPKIKRRLIASVVLLIPLMYVSMGHMMWNWPLPQSFSDNHAAMGLYQLLITTMIMVINQKFFISGFKGLIHKAPNMDTLVALGSTASYVYSVYALFAMTFAVMDGSHAEAEYMHELYFESAATILTLITVGKYLEAISKGRTTDALKGLMKLSPKTAVVYRDGKEISIPIEAVRIRDLVVVKPGENIPVDGIVEEGDSAVNESALTGESIPVDKQPGDSVSAATINTSGYLIIKVTRVGADTTLSKIIQMVSDAASTKAPIAKIADKVSGVFVPAVISIAAVTFAVWIIAGVSFGFALARAISVLVISCPCALGLATPVAIMVGNGMGAKNGILFKTAVSLEETGKVQIVALDKTGTITKGEPVVTDIVAAKGVDEKELLAAAYSLEKKSEHPLAKAVAAKCGELNISANEVTDFHALPGNGVEAILTADDNREECKLLGGSLSFVKKMINVACDIEKAAISVSDEGKTPLLFVQGDKLLGMIAVADVIKEDSAEAIKELRNMGIRVVMLTGDNHRTANAIGKLAGVDEVAADVLPDGKEEIIRRLQHKGRVAMVGDGINDAPALTRADIGIAIGAGTDIAIDAADVVLMKSSLMDTAAAIRLSRATLRNIHENLFWAFFYNVIGIPLAAGVWIPLFGLMLNPMFGAAAMSLSSFCVITNALRLNIFKMHETGRDNKIKNIVYGNLLIPENSNNIKNNELKEKSKMTTITLKVKGMMCMHCEAHVKKALEALEGVDSAAVSHENETAVVEAAEDITDDVLKAAVTEAGYEVADIVR